MYGRTFPHGITELFFMMMASVLDLNVHFSSMKILGRKDKSTYDYLKGWEISFCGTNTDLNEFAELQQQISGVILNDATNAFAFHGAPDIFEI